jgi:hypothetical protein
VTKITVFVVGIAGFSFTDLLTIGCSRPCTVIQCSRMNTKLVVTNYITINIDIGSLMFFPALRRGSAATCFLGLRVRIPPRAWMSVCCVCCVLSGGGLCFALVARPEES